MKHLMLLYDQSWNQAETVCETSFDIETITENLASLCMRCIYKVVLVIHVMS